VGCDIWGLGVTLDTLPDLKGDTGSSKRKRN
jgi:hypothetical protein